MSVLPQQLITGVGATPVAVTAKTWARGVTIEEDVTGAAAGLVLVFPNGKTVDLAAGKQQVIGNVPGVGGMNNGPLVGQPASSVGGGGNSATGYCTVASIGANTIVKVVEYN